MFPGILVPIVMFFGLTVIMGTMMSSTALANRGK